MATDVNFGTQRYFGFDPRSVPNCVLWMDALDSNKVSLSGSNVTGWTDKSSNAYVFSNATGYTYNVTKFNSTYPSFYAPSNVPGNFVGSNTSFSLSQPASFFVVCQLLDSAAGGYIFDSTNSGNRMAFIAYGGGKPVLFAGVELSNTVTTTFTSPGLHGGVFNSTSSLVYSNATQTISGNAGTQGATGLIIGSRFSLNGAWGGHLCELLMFSRIVTTAERQQIEGYLGSKWGLTSVLPATHPYKLQPPVLRQLVPVDVPGCILWFDAYDPSSFTLSGSNLTSITDKSGTGSSVSTFDATTVSWGSNTLNSLPSFDTTSGHFRGPFSTTDPITKYRHTTFIVTQLDSSPGNGYPCVSMCEAATGSTTFYRNLDYSTTPVFRTVGFLTNVGVTQFTSQFGNPFIWVEFYDGTAAGNSINSFYNYNNARPSSTALISASQSTTPTHFGIGTDGFTTSYNVNTWTGKISEVLIYNTILNAGEISLIEGYLANKWKLRSALTTTHPFYNFPPSSAIFTPLSTSNCVLWLDGADTTSNSMTFSGANITTWKDKSGNGRDAVLQATYTGATIGSASVKYAPNFVGTSRYLVTYPSFPNSAYSVFTVQYATTNSGYMRVVHGAQTNQYLFVGTSNGTVAAFTGSGAAWNDVAGTSTTNFNTWRVVGAVVSGTSITVYGDGTSLVTKTGTTGAFSDLLIGNDNANTQQWNGNIGEILVYSGAVSSNDRRRIEGYLAWKWGIQTSLPTTHTFSKIRP